MKKIIIIASILILAACSLETKTPTKTEDNEPNNNDVETIIDNDTALPDAEIIDENNNPDSDKIEPEDNETTDETPDKDIVSDKFLVVFDDKIREETINLIAAAKKSIDFTTYTFRDTGVVGKLQTAYTKGVKVRGAVGQQNTEINPTFPITYLEDGDNGIMHEKFFIIDGETSVITSSNFAYNQILNFMVVIKNDPETAALLKKEFEQLFAQKNGANKTTYCQDGCDLGWGKLYFSPGSGCDTLTDELKTEATDKNYIAMYTITDSAPMYNSLTSIIKNGKKLYGIFDSWAGSDGKPVNGTVLDDLNSLGAEIEYLSRDITWHHKFFVNNSFLEFGSMNWTHSGCSENDEIFATTKDAFLIDSFKSYIEQNLN